MELQFERDIQMEHEVVAEVTLCQEETLESIVPDACPDIHKIIDVCGQAMLTGKQAEEGVATVNGVVRAVILYQPEDDSGLRRMEVSLPFTCQANAPGLTGMGTVFASPRLRMAEARALNPRKVLLRVDLAVELVACQPAERSICVGVADNADPTICQKKHTGEHLQRMSVQEKPFSFSDQLRLPTGQGEGGQLMALWANPVCTESKLIGSKLIFKGTVELDLLLQDFDHALSQYHESLPFSQIIEVSGDSGGSECDCLLQVELVDVRCENAAENRMLNLTLELLAQGQVLCRRPVTVLQDLYSTAREMETEIGTQTLNRLVERTVRPQPVRELIETERMVRSVVDSRVALGQMVHKRGQDGLQIEAEAWVAVLYLDEDDQLDCVRKMIPVRCTIPAQAEAKCDCRCRVQGDVYGTPAAGGLEVRFGIEFDCLLTEDIRVEEVGRAALGTERSGEDGKRPSIVLRMLGERESLWDLAKHYGTTEERILQANEMEEQAIPAGQMLLIPSVR